MKNPKRRKPAPPPPPPPLTGRARQRERLRTMAAQVKQVLTEIPHAAALHAELEENLLVLQFLDAEHDLLTAQLARVHRQRRASEAGAGELSSRLAALLYGTFGRDRLRELNLPPRGGRRTPRPAPGGPSAVH